jgi:hypothetical protein
MRPENQPEAANLTISGTMGNCGGGSRRFFPKLLLKSGAYRRIAGQNERRNPSDRAQTQGGDSHRLGRGSRDFRTYRLICTLFFRFLKHEIAKTVNICFFIMQKT